MKYDKKIIGQRIKTERIAAGFKTQGDFAKALGFAFESRQTIGNWENGKVLPCLCDLLKICEICDCEIGYLLGEYENRTREITDINRVTGLSEESIKQLKILKLRKTLRTTDGKEEHLYNLVLENEDFWYQFEPLFINYLNSENNGNYMNNTKYPAEINAIATARYSLNRLFENLIDDIYRTIHKSKSKKLF